MDIKETENLHGTQLVKIESTIKHFFTKEITGS